MDTQATVNNGMAQGTPILSQVTPQSPNFNPATAPQPTTPTPSLQPMAPLNHLHAAMKRRGITPPPQQNPQQQAVQSMMPQGQAPQGVPVPPGAQMPPQESTLLIKALEDMSKPLKARMEMLTKKEQSDNEHFDKVREEYMMLNSLMKNDMTAHGEGTEMPHA